MIQAFLKLAVVFSINCLLAPDPILILNDKNQEETIAPGDHRYKEYSEIANKLKTVHTAINNWPNPSPVPLEEINTTGNQIVLTRVKTLFSAEPKFIDKCYLAEMFQKKSLFLNGKDNPSIEIILIKYANVFLLRHHDNIQCCKYRIDPAGYTSHKTHNDDSTKDSASNGVSNNDTPPKRWTHQVLLGIWTISMVLFFAAIKIAQFYVMFWKDAPRKYPSKI